MEEVALLESLKIDRSRFVLNYNMYIFNQEAKEFWKEQGINHLRPCGTKLWGNDVSGNRL